MMEKQTPIIPELIQMSNSKILIIHDEPEILVLLKSSLVSQNFWVENTTDAGNALKLAIKIQPALILLGVELSGLNGYHICKQIKQNKLTSQIPVILISDLNDENSTNKGFQAGAVDFISKPIRQNVLTTRVNAQLALRNLQIEHENQNKLLLLQIKEKEQTELLLKESEERYRLISNVITDYMFSTKIMPDGSLNLNWVAGAFESISGYTVEEYKHRGGWRSTIHPDDISIDDKDIKDLNQNKSTASELRTINKQGETVWVQVFAFPVWDDKANCLKGIYGAVQNISSRKNAEIKLRSSESQYRELLEKVGLISIILDIDGKVVFANDFLLELTGYTHKELIHADWFDLMIPESNADMKKLLLDGLKMGKIETHFENPICTKSGQLLDIVWSNVMRFDSEGKALSVASIGEDITERKQAEISLKESEERFRYFFENNTSYMLQIDSETGQIIDSNPAASAFYGYSKEELKNMNINEINIASNEKIKEIIKSVRQNVQNHHLVTHRLHSGETRAVEIYATPILTNNRKIHFVIIHDITNRKLAEDKIIKLNAELEKRVEERTKELDNKNADLARVNKLFVGRELKMIELKNKIKELEAEIAALSKF